MGGSRQVNSRIRKGARQVFDESASAKERARRPRACVHAARRRREPPAWRDVAHVGKGVRAPGDEETQRDRALGGRRRRTAESGPRRPDPASRVRGGRMRPGWRRKRCLRSRGPRRTDVSNASTRPRVTASNLGGARLAGSPFRNDPPANESAKNSEASGKAEARY